MKKFGVFLFVLTLSFGVGLSVYKWEKSSKDREPAQVSLTSARGDLLELARLQRQILPESGDFRSALVQFYIDIVSRNKEANVRLENLQRIANQRVLFFLLNDRGVKLFLNTSPDPKADVNQIFAKMNEVSSLLLSEGRYTPTELNLAEMRASVSFLRKLSQHTLKNMKVYGSGLSTQNELNSLLADYKRVKSVAGKISTLSTVQKNPKELQARIQSIALSSEWRDLQKLYIPLQGSSEIDGALNDMEVAEGVRLGIDSQFNLLKHLTSLVARVPASEFADFQFDEDDFLSNRVPAQEEDEEPAVDDVKIDQSKILKTNLILVGLIPGEYFPGSDKNKFELGLIEIKDRVIVRLEKILPSQVEALKPGLGQKLIVLNSGNGFDAIYPGLIDLHNHTKQNNLPVWGAARGQFQNRFEWRGWSSYKAAVSANMNPWITYGKPVTCAAFRWSELQAMVVGTLYLQGPSSCVKAFGINQVEDNGSYITQRLGVQAPTDIVLPTDAGFVFFWQVIRPIIKNENVSYERALHRVIKQTCPSLPGTITADNLNSAESLKTLTDKKWLEANCVNPADGFVRYVYFFHKTIASRKNYINDPRYSGIIGHLAEGRRTDDSYNLKEMEFIKLYGLVAPRVNFVHGVGIPVSDFSLLARNEMGLVWSPFSNLILYGETLDIAKAKQAGVRLALGSDWLPTGTKGSLEEVKLAAQYIDSVPGLKAQFTDEDLYKMMTENPARMIRRWDEVSTGGKIVEASIGKIKVGSMGSLIATSVFDSNPYTNLVRKVTEESINLVVVDGNPVYGDPQYLRLSGFDQFEVISQEAHQIEGLIPQLSGLPEGEATAAAKKAQLRQMATRVAGLRLTKDPLCRFSGSGERAFVHQNSVQFDKDLLSLRNETGVNLDRFFDVKNILAIGLLTQSKNATGVGGKREDRVTSFPPLYSCNDPKHRERVSQMIPQEWPANVRGRLDLRKQQKLGKIPEGLAEKFK